MTEHDPLPFVISAGRAWTGSLFAMLGLALVSTMTLTALKPGPMSFTLVALVSVLDVVTLWRGWGRVCDRLTLRESDLVLRSLWPSRSVALQLTHINRVWLSPNSGTVRFFTDDTSYVLRVRGDRIDGEFEDRLGEKLPAGVVSHHYNMTLW